MVPAERARLMRLPLQVANWIVEELEFKLAFYQEYPWLILEVLAPLWGGSVEQSKARARATTALYDECAGTSRVPRGFFELLDGDTDFREELVTYGNGDESLLKFTCLLDELIAYALYRRRRETLSLCMERSQL